MVLMTRVQNTEMPEALVGPFNGSDPLVDWRVMAASDHFVQFYESGVALVNSVTGFMGAGLDAGDYCIVIATSPHRQALEDELKKAGHDLSTAQESRQYVSIDAGETVASFMLNGSPEPGRFLEIVGRVVAEASASGRRVRAFGEMVALLWAEGNHAGAVRVEELWNELSRNHAFALFCAYSMDGFGCQSHAASFKDICTNHSRVIPAESYAALSSADERMREISALQQRARSLEAEIARSRELEAALREHVSQIEALNARLKRSVTETHHRVKNNLQLMAALIDMQSHSGSDMVPVTEFVRLGQNIQALGIIHEILTGQSLDDRSPETISVKRVLDQLLSKLESTLGERRLLRTLDEVSLPGKQTTALTLVANELVSNAAKHATGDIEITLRLAQGAVRLEVSDHGPGFPAGFSAEAASHTGLELIESIAQYDLRAETAYCNRETGGARVVLTFAVTPESLRAGR